MGTTLYDILQAHFGVKTGYRISTVTQVELTVTKVFSGNPNRVGFVIINTGTANIYISPVNTVAKGSGILLLPTGGSLAMVWDEDFELVSSEFYGIADGAASKIYALEVYTL